MFSIPSAPLHDCCGVFLQVFQEAIEYLLRIYSRDRLHVLFVWLPDHSDLLQMGRIHCTTV